MAFGTPLLTHYSVPKPQITPILSGGAYIAHNLMDDQFQVRINDTWQDLTIKGVNMGMAKPGTWPGEAAISYEEYYRWFQWIGNMNANSIRVYTIHPPAFYRALYHYNKLHKDPIFLFQGIWIDEEPLIETLDAYDDRNYFPFRDEIERIVDVLHGNITLPMRTGHAFGTYSYDVSDYVLGWILGIEWLPEMVENTNVLHPDKNYYSGQYLYTENASPFECFLAEMMDHTLTYEVDHYGTVRPISFTNWVTTDLLTHPYEPSESEDLVSVNPNHIIPSEGIPYFASYHVYPYYPEFLNLDPKYTEFVDETGQKNAYQGYLHDLKKAHDMPVLIAEVGIPSSRGMTHKNIHGWNQGFIEETAQGEILCLLFESILREDYLGGLLFAWQDEWFKRTWNTMDHDNPDRRPYWSNAQTNEQQFGLLSFDRHKIKLNGQSKGWGSREMVVYDPAPDSGFQEIRMDHDERYLYLSLQQKEPFTDETIYLMLNTKPNSGNTTHLNLPYSTEDGMDFLIILSQSEPSQILVDAYYDFHSFLYAPETIVKKDSGLYTPIMLALNKEFTIPATGETSPFEDYETGLLIEGIGDPYHSDYNSLADFTINSAKGYLELRLPWLLLGFTDPSLMEIQGDFWKDGFQARENIKEISFVAMRKHQDTFYSSVSHENYTILKNTLHQYGPFEWTFPYTQERLKSSYPIIKELYRRFD